MEEMHAGDLVTVTTAGPSIDGIVVDVLTSAKVVVAIRDRARGPVMRTVGRDTLTHRSDAGPDDRALQLLIRRTPPHTHGAVRGAAAGGGGGRAGHTRGASHRPTAK